MKQASEFLSTRVAGWPAFETDRSGDVVTGTLTTQVVPGAPLRTQSAWTGPLDGTSRFTLISLEDTMTPDAQLSRFRGDLVLSTPRGDLIGQDDGLWDLATGRYVDVYRVTAGTGDFQGATGVIVLTGTLDPVNGQGVSEYRGVVSQDGHEEYVGHDATD
jgi:hypothetical protein